MPREPPFMTGIRLCLHMLTFRYFPHWLHSNVTCMAPTARARSLVGNTVNQPPFQNTCHVGVFDARQRRRVIFPNLCPPTTVVVHLYSCSPPFDATGTFVGVLN